MTDEQHQQWQDLIRRSVAARAADDRDAYRALQAQRRDLIAHLGPERVEVLRAESHQKAMQNLHQQRDQRRERQLQAQRERLERLRLTTQWQNRPHSRLTDTELTQAVRHAERQHAEHQTAADRARQQLAEREPAVAAGHGPRVTQLHRLRVNAERQGTVERIESRWRALSAQAADAAERATHKQFDAERTRWWQPGRREQLQTEAAADKALSQRAAAQADELARHAAELQRQLGGPGVWRHARPHLERAEASYEHDRRRAHEADQNDLARLRDRITSQDTAAADASTRRTELVAEQQLRATMPDAQATFEQQLRSQAIERQQRHEQAALERQREQFAQMDLDYHERSVQADIHADVDRDGPSLGF